MLIFIPIVVFGGWPMLITVYLLALTALYEILKMNRIHIFSIPGILSLIALSIVIMPRADYSYITVITESQVDIDRKSTRLNSSHVAISYAVFFLIQNKKEYD